jgi:hypothetical protein
MSFKYQKTIEFNKDSYFLIIIYSVLLIYIFYVIFRDYLYIGIPVCFAISFFYQYLKKDKVQYLDIDDHGLRFSYLDFMHKTFTIDILWYEIEEIEVYLRRNRGKCFNIKNSKNDICYLPDFGYNFSEVYLNLVKFAKANNSNIRWVDGCSSEEMDQL